MTAMRHNATLALMSKEDGPPRIILSVRGKQGETFEFVCWRERKQWQKKPWRFYDRKRQTHIPLKDPWHDRLMIKFRSAAGRKTDGLHWCDIRDQLQDAKEAAMTPEERMEEMRNDPEWVCKACGELCEAIGVGICEDCRG